MDAQKRNMLICGVACVDWKAHESDCRDAWRALQRVQGPDEPMSYAEFVSYVIHYTSPLSRERVEDPTVY